MRGFLEQRFRDTTAVTVQGEYRVPINRRVGVVAFASAGQVAESPVEMDPAAAKIAGGMGLRIALNGEQKLNLRIDIAVSESGASPYVNMGEAF